MRSILERLANGDILVADGAIGTMLMSAGLPSGACPERMNLERPELLESIARRYLEAGADVIQTNTFGASPLKLAHFSLEGKMKEINAAAVRAVRKIVREKAYSYASCGPSGRLLKPHGDVEPDAVYESFRQQAEVLVNEGVDMVCVETMTDLIEAVLAVKAFKSVAPDLPVAACMTFDSTPRGFFTVMGVTPARGAVELAKAGAEIIGSNCGYGIDHMIAVAQEFRKHTSLPLIIQPNAGLPQMQGGALIFPETPEFMAGRCHQLIECDVGIIGGCCGTTPDHIAAVRKAVDDFVVSRQR
ncbi:MAG TPA: homocysteine S-methyltransferase family protein [Candidatus Deferrimicrobium sp.]|nr:homocysteine S-methyltransferase family protein [Candidatus Deferrimicrobium sp.]